MKKYSGTVWTNADGSKEVLTRKGDQYFVPAVYLDISELAELGEAITDALDDEVQRLEVLLRTPGPGAPAPGSDPAATRPLPQITFNLRNVNNVGAPDVQFNERRVGLT